jgi:hypothetical protein
LVLIVQLFFNKDPSTSKSKTRVLVLVLEFELTLHNIWLLPQHAPLPSAPRCSPAPYVQVAPLLSHAFMGPTRNARRALRRKPTLQEQYAPYLRKLMAFKDGVEGYPKGHQFSQEELLSIRPRDIVRWMCRDAFGTPDPGPDDKPTERRSAGLGFAKKAISFFMPHKNMHWNVSTEMGNPTKSVAVNDLMKQVRKMEVRKQGKKSNAKRDLK